MESLSQRLAYLQSHLQGSTCRLIAATKTQSTQVLQSLYDLGFKTYGENKVQELTEKQKLLPGDIEWHLIGHLQKNKVKYIAPFVHLIHSVDSVELLVEINKQGIKNNRVIHCLLQIHIATEDTKFGLSEQEAIELLCSPLLNTFQNIHIYGLMGMATFTENQTQIKQEFTQLRRFFETCQQYNQPGIVTMKELSMGMSNDYILAIECGSTLVRVGSALFGARN